MRHHRQPRLRWSDIYSLLDCIEDEQLKKDAVLTFPNKPNATAFISHLHVIDDRIVVDARFDSGTATEYWRTAAHESVSEALSATPVTWLQIRWMLEQVRNCAKNFHNLAIIGFPPDFADERFCNFISKLDINNDGAPVAIAFYDPE